MFAVSVTKENQWIWLIGIAIGMGFCCLCMIVAALLYRITTRHSKHTSRSSNNTNNSFKNSKYHQASVHTQHNNQNSTLETPLLGNDEADSIHSSNFTANTTPDTKLEMVTTLNTNNNKNRDDSTNSEKSSTAVIVAIDPNAAKPNQEKVKVMVEKKSDVLIAKNNNNNNNNNDDNRNTSHKKMLKFNENNIVANAPTINVIHFGDHEHKRQSESVNVDELIDLGRPSIAQMIERDSIAHTHKRFSQDKRHKNGGDEKELEIESSSRSVGIAIGKAKKVGISYNSNVNANISKAPLPTVMSAPATDPFAIIPLSPIAEKKKVNPFAETGEKNDGENTTSDTKQETAAVLPPPSDKPKPNLSKLSFY